MKHLKRFNEGIIKPDGNIKDTLHKVCYFLEDITLDKINLEFKHLNIEFVDVAKFTEELKTETEKRGVPKDANIMCGIKFAAVNGYKKMIYICIEPEVFINSINNKHTIQRVYPLLLEILRHESIHLQQILKTKKDFYNDEKNIPYSVYNLKRSPIINSKEYFSHKTEVMAYAQTFIDQCHNKNMSNEDILAALKGKKVVSWIQDIYYKMDKDTREQFIKNVYLYLNKE